MVPGPCLKVFCKSCLPGGVTSLTFKLFFPCLSFADLPHLFPFASSCQRDVCVTVSLLAMNVPVTKLHPSFLSPLLIEAVLDFGAAWS